MKKNNPKNILALIVGLIAFFIAFIIAPKLLAQGISYGHRTVDQYLVSGMAVQLDKEQNVSSDRKNYVERSNINQPESYIGVAADLDSTTASIGSVEDNVFIKSSGEVLALVSEEAGAIESGDKIILSPFRGAFMKAPDSSAHWSAIALGSTKDAELAPISSDNQETTRDVNFYRIPISLDNYSNFISQQSDSTSGIKRIGRAIVGKDVGEARIIVAFMVFLLIMVIEGGVVYGAVSSSLGSIGRNPLASKTIKKELVRVLVVALVILVLGLAFGYAILWI